MKKMIAAIAVILAMGLSSCADGGPADNPSTGDLDGDFKVGTAYVDGQPLTCVQTIYDRGIGLSCDWVAYHDQGSR
jgi:hypothetical protein